LNLAAARSSQHPGLENYTKQLIHLRDLAALQLTPEQITVAQRFSSQWHPQRSTANSTVEWREKPTGRRVEKEPAPPGAYPRCELE
jgi:hypothetical protein